MPTRPRPWRESRGYEHETSHHRAMRRSRSFYSVHAHVHSYWLATQPLQHCQLIFFSEPVFWFQWRIRFCREKKGCWIRKYRNRPMDMGARMGARLGSRQAPSIPMTATITIVCLVITSQKLAALYTQELSKVRGHKWFQDSPAEV